MLMDTLKKFILINFIAIWGALGPVSILPALAQERETTETSQITTDTSTVTPQATSFQDTLVKFRQTREEFRKSRQEAKTSGRRADRAAKEQKFLEKRKAHLTRLVDVLIKRSEGMKNRVVNNEAIYGNLEASIVGEIDADITTLNDFKTGITQAQTADGLKALAEEIKVYRKDVTQVKIKRLMLIAHIARFENMVVKKAQDRSAKIDTKLDELEAAGKDVLALRTLLDDANVKLTSVKDRLAQLKTDVDAQEITETKLSEIRTKLNSVKDELKEVYDLFGQIATQGQSL